MHLGGATVPEYDESKGAAPAAVRDVANARWWMLYQDPLFELRLLEGRKGDELPLPPHVRQPGEEALHRARKLQAPEAFSAALRRWGLEAVWAAAYADVVEAQAFAQLLAEANLPYLDTTLPIARALVASLIARAEGNGLGVLVGEDRDALVEMLIPALGGKPMGILEWGVGVFASLAAPVAGKWVRQNKRGVFDLHASKVGDIAHYQARGEKIRGFIRERIAEAGPEVYVVCHSLGGIACVDLLVEEDLRNVKGLVTAGSQAGFFYELDALVSLPFGRELPGHFPRWENYYDPADFLSYRAEPAFEGRVRDVAVDNGQPFPQAHSAYWDNRDVVAGIQRMAGGG